jgi:nitroreductase/uncharacterized protein YndB with AHSA1/START domain
MMNAARQLPNRSEALMEIDSEAIDAALTTTRAVRRRLDLDRPVDDQILLDCIDVAEQAPTGGNLGSRRWLVVRDPRLKEQLAAIYREGVGQWMIDTSERLEGTDHPDEKVMGSAAHLVEHLAEVPAIVIPTIIGRHDGSGRPGLFDSVIQAAWSFSVALRARGLGSAWVTAVFADEGRVKELLDIPDHMTEIVMLPVAWTKGTEFRPATRRPAREITYFDGFARTFARGPSSPMGLSDGPGTVAEVDIDATPAAVWRAVTDIDLPARFSEEFQGASWETDEDPHLGATFVGRNQHPAIGSWEVRCFVIAFEPERAFGWRTAEAADDAGASWRFDLEPNGGNTRLKFSVMIGPGPSGISVAIDAMPDKESRILRNRVAEHHANMQLTVEGIKTLVENADNSEPN